MSDLGYKSRWRWQRLVVVGGTLLTFALLMVLHADRRQQRVKQLIAEITSSGGSVQIPDPVGRRIWSWWENRFASGVTIVNLSGIKCDGQWLRKNNCLRDLS